MSDTLNMSSKESKNNCAKGSTIFEPSRLPLQTALVSRALLEAVQKVKIQSHAVRHLARVEGRQGVKSPADYGSPGESIACIALRVETALRYFSLDGKCFIKPKTLMSMFKLKRQTWARVAKWLAAQGISRAEGNKRRWSIPLPASSSLDDVLTLFVPVPAAAVFGVQKHIDFYVITIMHECAEASLAYCLENGVGKEKRRSVLPLVSDHWAESTPEVWMAALSMGRHRVRGTLARLASREFYNMDTGYLTPKEGQHHVWAGRNPYEMLAAKDFERLRGEVFGEPETLEGDAKSNDDLAVRADALDWSI